MPLVEKHIIDINNWLDQELNQLCFLSKNLFNYSNYLIWQKFLFKGEDLDDEKIGCNSQLKTLGDRAPQGLSKTLNNLVSYD